ncbi:Dam family site-specific DNA-(adenine-N6)-methyltransferase [Methylomagnum sp.]
MKNPPHPIQYQGSKRNLAPVILGYYPKSINRLLEPFAGSAAMTIATAARGLAQSYIVNDLNKPLADLLALIVGSPEAMADSYENLWKQQTGDSVGHYYQVRDDFNRSQDPRLFLYLLARCVKGAVRYNSEGLLNQSPDKRRLGTRPDTMRANILGVSRLLKGKVIFSALDYREILSQARADDLVYMDPPYQGVCGNRDARYYSGIDNVEFVAALDELNSRNIAYIVSYDGRCGDKRFGESLPTSLDLAHIEIEAGTSSQATLLGRKEVTYESLYLSRALTKRLSIKSFDYRKPSSHQLTIFETSAGYASAI